jgi:glycosyltransferase involved in cell wall biosynthesis
MLRKILSSRFVLKVAREALPGRLRQKVGEIVLPRPTEAHFQAMLADTVPERAIPGRVVLVCGSLQPGGAERQVVNTLVGLAPVLGNENLTLLCDYLHAGAKERYDFYLPQARRSGATVREIRKDFSSKDPLPPSFEKAARCLHPGLVADIAALYREFRVLQPEVVHAWLDWSNVRAGLAAVLAGVPRVLLSGRNLSPRHFALNADYYYPAYRALLECGDRVTWLNNSQAGANDYADWLSVPAERIRVLRNGTRFEEQMRPPPERYGELRARWRIPASVPLIGGMFRFGQEKRPLLWIEAAVQIAAALPDAHFVIFGEGPMRSEMETLIRQYSLGARVQMPGVVMSSLDGLAPCDLVLLTSSGEGIPNVLLEAQWLGIPVVTVNAGGAGEAVNDGTTGLVIESDNAADIAAGVLGILRDAALRAKARKEGPSFVNARYGMDRMIAETLTAYDLMPAESFSGSVEAMNRISINEP